MLRRFTSGLPFTRMSAAPAMTAAPASFVNQFVTRTKTDSAAPPPPATGAKTDTTCCDEPHGRHATKRARPSADEVLLSGQRPAVAEGVTHLLQYNRRWAEVMTKSDRTFFEKLANQQSPKYFWIGCSDSRVPANQILGLAPGEIFVHRNVANIVVHSDLNCLSATQYAVDVLHVEDILLVGHYGCGGVAAALSGGRYGVVDNWVRYVKDVRNKYRDDLWKLPDWNSRLDLLCELNVIEQTFHLATSGVLKDQWSRSREIYNDPELLKRFTSEHLPENAHKALKANPEGAIGPVEKRLAAGRKPVRIHGMIYDVADGILHPLVTVTYRDRAFEQSHAAAARQVELYHREAAAKAANGEAKKPESRL